MRPGLLIEDVTVAPMRMSLKLRHDRGGYDGGDTKPGETAMNRRTRKFIGATAMLIFVSLYAVCAMVLAEAKPVHDAPGVVQAVFYAIVGLAWILPLMPLITWMERPDPEREL